MQPSSTSASAVSSAAHSIIDELTDRDRGKNIIVYNLPQATDHAADKVSFLALCKTVFNLDVLVTSYTFRKKTGKQAQTLIGVFCT